MDESKNEIETDGIRFVTADGTRFVTSNSGLSTIQGKVNAGAAANANAMRQGFDAVFQALNRLIDDSRTANNRRHDELVQFDTKFEERLSAEVGSLHDVLSTLNDKIDASPAGVDSVDQLREQVDHVVQQVQRLKDVIVKEMRETLSLRGLLETNAEKIGESNRKSSESQEQLARQQAALDAMQTMLRDLQQRSQHADKQALERRDASHENATQTRELIESLRGDLADMRVTSGQANSEIVDRLAAVTHEHEQLKRDIANSNRRISTVIGLGFVGVVIIVGAIVATKYL